MVRLTILACGVALTLLGSATTAAANTVTGSFGDPADFALTYTITGPELALKAGSANQYEGTYLAPGTPITISGTITITRGAGTLSNVSMSARIGTVTSWKWPPDALSQGVTGTTVTQPYALSHVPGPADYQRGYISGGASISVCGGVCASASVSFFVELAPPAARPAAQAKLRSGYLRVGRRYRLPYWVKDDSGKAYAYADLFDAGTPIGHAESRGLLTADGSRLYANIKPSASRKGPLYFCVWAKNGAGVESARAPRTSCRWLPLLVSIRRVSNHCGGSGWSSIVAVQNYFGNTSSYYDPGTRRRYKVSFTAACDLHDAGYGGHTVRDKLHRTRSKPLGPVIDFRRWSRRRIDRKFQTDMALLCRRQIPRRAATARRRCVGGTVRYRLVRAIGNRFYDADLMTPGIQATGHRDNT